MVLLLVSGFGDAGVAVRLLGICDIGVEELTIVSNGAGGGDYGLGL